MDAWYGEADSKVDSEADSEADSEVNSEADSDSDEDMGAETRKRADKDTVKKFILKCQRHCDELLQEDELLQGTIHDIQTEGTTTV